MSQLSFWSEELHVNPSQSQVSAKVSKTQEETLPSPIVEFLTTLNPSGSFGKTSQASSVQTVDGILVPSSGRWQNSGMGSHTECLTLNTSEWPSDAVVSLLSDVLESGSLQPKFYLSPTACQGILRRAEKRGKKLPELLSRALQTVSKQHATTTQEQTDSI